MKVMPHKGQDLNDLEYLAGLGFEALPVSEKEVNSLRKKVKRLPGLPESFSYSCFALACVGSFIGLSLFFMSNNAPDLFKSRSATGLSAVLQKDVPIREIVLDTLIIEENFVRAKAARHPQEIASADPRPLSDTVLSLPALTTSSVPLAAAPDDRIRYALNSPVIYLYDLKVSDYHQLYFKKNQIVPFSSGKGIPAHLSGLPDLRPSEKFMESGDNWFLHEAIAEALLEYRKKNFSRCLYVLSEISNYSGAEDINAAFYSGMCHYHLKQYSEAIAAFDLCIGSKNNAFLLEAEFYKALSLLENGKEEEGGKLLEKISEEGGFYSGKAQALRLQ